MEMFQNVSVNQSRDNDMICYGIGLTKVESSGKEDGCCEGREEFEYKRLDHGVKPNTEALGITRSIFGTTEELKIDAVSNPENITRENKVDFESRESQRKLKLIMREVERLELQKEALGNKVDELKQEIAKGRLGKTKQESYSQQIKVLEKKVEMLTKRISHERKLTNIPLSSSKKIKCNSRASKSLYVNSLRSDEVLSRKMKSKLVLREEELQTKVNEDLSKEQNLKEKKEKEKWQSRRSKLFSDEESDEELEILGAVIKKPKRTTVFCPPIPDPMAKKRPRDSAPMKKPEKLNDRHNSETRKRLVPNSKRVSQNRIALYEKQLEFENKHGLETEETIENLNRAVLSYQEHPADEERSLSVTKQQLHLIGALSECQDKNW